MFFRKLWSFVKRGFIISFSYKTYAVLGVLGIFIGVLKFGFMAGFLQKGNSFPLLTPYGGDLMAYLITGSVYMSYVGVAMNSFQSAIRSEQSMGTLEYLLMSNTPLSQMILFSGVSSFIWTTISVGAIFLIMISVFDIEMNVNVLLSIFILLLSVVCISGIGLISAGVIMVTKKGDPVSWVFTTLSGLVSGVLYPVETLPKFLQRISYFLPPTYGIRALRKSLLVGATFLSVRMDVSTLLLMSLITIPLGLFIFRWGFNKAREKGSLVEY